MTTINKTQEQLEDLWCPVMSADCIGRECALWVTAYTIEGYECALCAYELQAIKNSDGKIPV